ncbi:uncharacterized protein [Aristolochia californica]|uniref:uncharacterized protein n=1 Tax=Aristolochia californica TaxID=171875 RepID=UPI0035E2B93C
MAVLMRKNFSHQRVPTYDRVNVAVFHLLGEAQLWYQLIEVDSDVVDWDEFKRLCSLRFGPPAYNNPLGDLVLLCQTGAVEQYKKLFQEKLARASSMVQVDQQVALFTAGLTEALKLEVEFYAPVDLSSAMNIACALEL